MRRDIFHAVCISLSAIDEDCIKENTANSKESLSRETVCETE